MPIQPIPRAKLFAFLLCGLLLGTALEPFQMAHADDGWTSLLKPLVNSVILPAVNNRIDQWATKLEQKSGSKMSSTAATMSANGSVSPAPVTSPSSMDSFYSSGPATNDWQLPQEPVH